MQHAILAKTKFILASPHTVGLIKENAFSMSFTGSF